jgi:hypothetical protein
MKSCVWVLRIGDYRPDLCKYTIPNIKAYAERIGAEYREITERKFPDFPIDYEKMQMWELAKDYDWNILVDADILISSKFPNIIDHAKEDPKTVYSYEQFDMTKVFKADPVLMSRPTSLTVDGKPAVVSTSGNFIVTSKHTHSIYRPLGLSFDDMKSRTSIEWLVGEYNYAYNIATHGFNIKTFYHLGIPRETVYHFASTSGDKGGDIPAIIEKLEAPAKTILLINCNQDEQLDSVTLPFFEAYAKKIGADMDSIFTRSDIYDFLKEYDRVLCVNEDVLIRPDSPNLFDIVPETKLGLLYESRFVAKTPELNQRLQQENIPPQMWNNKFYGFGVIVTSRAHADVFRTLTPNQQDIDLNVQLTRIAPPMFELPYQFNFQQGMDRFTGDDRHAAYFINYAGGYKALGYQGLVDLIKKDIKVLEDAAPDYKFKKNIGIVVGGGLGDQVAAEPTVRYIVEHLYKGENVVISCNWPELFSHIDAPAFEHGKGKHDKNYYEMYTLKSPDDIIWSFVSHTLTSAVDYAAISAMRMQLPLKHKEIRLPKSEEAKKSVSDLSDYILVHPGKGWFTKTFPSEVWQTYIDILVDNGFKVAIIGKTINDGQGLVEVDASRCLDLRDKLSLQQLIEAIRMCRALLTNDSSPVHIAGDSDCHLGVIATCKHIDYILPFRKGSIYYKAEGLEADTMYYDFDRRPSTIDGSTIDKSTEARLLECLPKPERILEWAKRTN